MKMVCWPKRMQCPSPDCEDRTTGCERASGLVDNYPRPARCPLLDIAQLRCHQSDALDSVVWQSLKALARVALQQSELLNYRPSVVAAAVLYADRLARAELPLWPSCLAHLSGYSTTATPELAAAIAAIQWCAPMPPQRRSSQNTMHRTARSNPLCIFQRHALKPERRLAQRADSIYAVSACSSVHCGLLTSPNLGSRALQGAVHPHMGDGVICCICVPFRKVFNAGQSLSAWQLHPAQRVARHRSIHFDVKVVCMRAAG